MIIKGLKYGAVGVTSVVLIGTLLFGNELASYVWCSAKSVQSAVKDSVPIEFELQRAREMVDGIIPELHANIRLIAEEEVEVAALKNDIVNSQQRLDAEKQQITKLRDKLTSQKVSYELNGRTYSRQGVARRLAHRFDHYKEGRVILASKHRLLETRERSLQAAVQVLERTRARKSQLRQKIEALAAQHRLLKAASVGTQVQFDGSRLTKAEKLIADITKRLDVAERVLDHESDFLIPTSPVDGVSEAELIDELDEYFRNSADIAASADRDKV